MYKSIVTWRDLEDNHLYAEGDEYPHDGRIVPDKRIAELSSRQNKAGFALIQAVAVENEGKPIQTAETPKRAGRGRKKAS